MSNRYRRARALGADHFEAQVRSDRELLSRFGLKLLDVSGGISVAFERELKSGRINPWNCTTIDGKLFEWLEPLLQELARRREEDLKTG